MKKFILASVVLFIIGVGCKKANIDNTGGLCACSPIMYANFGLVIKNSTGDDLLNSQTAGAYSKEQISLYQKDANGNTTPIAFTIRQPITFGDSKLDYYQLTILDGSLLRNAQNTPVTLYLKLGSGKVYELNAEADTATNSIIKLSIDKKEAEKEQKSPVYYSVFYLMPANG